jgi:hypothetical protein
MEAGYLPLLAWLICNRSPSYELGRILYLSNSIILPYLKLVKVLTSASVVSKLWFKITHHVVDEEQRLSRIRKKAIHFHVWLKV